jgi:O-antigen/teichoic acid export membrane protein
VRSALTPSVGEPLEVDLRGSERSRRATLTSASLLAAQATAVASGLISVPLALGYLGVERYGLFLVVVSLIALLTLGDLGIANALLNTLTDAQAQGNRERAVMIVSAAALIVGAIVSIVAIVVVFVYPMVPWDLAMNVQGTPAARDAGVAVVTAIGLGAATVLLNLALQVRLAYQEGYVNGVFMAAGNVLSLIAVVAVTRTNLGFLGVVLALLGVPLLASAGNAALLLVRDRPWLRPTLSRATIGAARLLIMPGFGFFLYQAALVVAWSSQDAFIASRVSGARAAAEYGIAAKLFFLPTTAILAVVMPLWPAYRDAFARGDTAWVRRTMTKSVRRTVGFMVPFSLAILASAQTIVPLWIGAAIAPSTGLLAGAGVWAVFATTSTTLSVFLVALGRIRFLVISTVLTAIAHVVLSVTLGTAFGAAGVAWGTAIATLAFMLVPDIVYVRALLSKGL